MGWMQRARDVMQKHVIGVSRTTKIAVAAELARSSKIGVLPVLESERLCGIVLESDLESSKDVDMQVGSLMRNPIFAEENESIDEVSRKMVNHSLERMPVVDSRDTMTCIGMITSSDIVRLMKKK